MEPAGDLPILDHHRLGLPLLLTVRRNGLLPSWVVIVGAKTKRDSVTSTELAIRSEVNAATTPSTTTMEELVAVQPVAIPIETPIDGETSTPAAPEPPNRCCCSILHITTASYIISVTFAILIVINFVVKIAGYTDLEWNWELLFLCSDSIAVACLLYGTYIESAAFFQPFVILSIITISFLLLLLAYVGAAVYDPHSYPGEYLELLLHEHLNSASQRFHMELKNVVSLSASIAAVVIVIALGCHLCFVIVALRCARYFRMRPPPKKPSLPTTTIEAAVSERAKRPVKLVPEPLFDWLPMNPDIYAEPPAVWRGV